MAESKRITTPLTDEVVAGLHAGDQVLITGTILTGRDAAHQRLFDLIQKGEPLPVDLRGQIMFYVGPTPARPGKVIGSAGPTTSGRMDAFTPKLHELGLKASVGKGSRNEKVLEALKTYKAVYMAVTGGAAALVSRSIKAAEVVAYPELGPEAIRRLDVVDFPAVVINDMYGGDLYREGRRQYESA
jgi:fumarate hydratase subunit beta